jgi:hypothetical protein
MKLMKLNLLFVAAPIFLFGTGCMDSETKSPPPAGMAGVAAAPTAAAKAPASRQTAHGAGLNPHGTGQPTSAPASQPSGARAPGHPPMGTTQPAAGAASQPARPTIVKGTPQPGATSQAPNNKVFSGIVEESFNAAGYTYMRLKSQGTEEVWAAVIETQVAVGATVTLSESLTMTDFHSKTLNRTFPKIIFATLNSK